MTYKSSSGIRNFKKYNFIIQKIKQKYFNYSNEEKNLNQKSNREYYIKQNKKFFLLFLFINLLAYKYFKLVPIYYLILLFAIYI